MADFAADKALGDIPREFSLKCNSSGTAFWRKRKIGVLLANGFQCNNTGHPHLGNKSDLTEVQ